MHNQKTEPLTVRVKAWIDITGYLRQPLDGNILQSSLAFGEDRRSSSAPTGLDSAAAFPSEMNQMFWHYPTSWKSCMSEQYVRTDPVVNLGIIQRSNINNRCTPWPGDAIVKKKKNDGLAQHNPFSRHP